MLVFLEIPAPHFSHKFSPKSSAPHHNTDVMMHCIERLTETEMKKDEAVQRVRAEEARKSKQKAEALKDQNVEDLTVGMILYKRLGLTFGQ